MTGAHLALAAALCFTATGQLLFKAGTTAGRSRLVVLGIAALFAATASAFVALRSLGIGLVYMSTGLTHVLVLAGSRWLLGERIPRQRYAGSALVIMGILLYAASV